MESTVITALIAATAAIIGGAIAGIASYINTRHKIRELDVAASQKLRENYLQNAREYTKAIYVPLTLALSKLCDAYSVSHRTPSASEAIEPLRQAIDQFRSEIQQLRDRGAEAFLTNELEDKLRSFQEFLGASRDSTTLIRKAEIGFRVGLGGMAWAETTTVALIGRSATWWRSPRMSLSVLGVGFTYEATVVQSAPLESIEFSTRFTADTGEIRYLIKEVTLGGKPKESPAK
ncbi:hypothetical protein [Desulfobulbus sp.]|uniref:hypothetical protein n=1 Tax=Desulfobulbus sp. TaxID=895 RepID=UPI0027B9E0BA|nr:hypothetical protein [Desulfobulbus sp.]